MSRPLSPEVREQLWGISDPPGPDHDRCRVCDKQLEYPSHRRAGNCGSSYCEGYEDGAETAECGAPTHREAIAACVGVRIEEGSAVGRPVCWRTDLGTLYLAGGFREVDEEESCTADDAVRAEEVSDG